MESEKTLGLVLDLLRERPEKPLRVCRVCGLQAFNEKELEAFRKNKACPYGYATICIKCDNNRRKEELHKTQEFIEIFRIRSPDRGIRCYFCGEEITQLDRRKSKSLDVHSLNGNHKNWDPKNKVPTHRGCHTRFHTMARDTRGEGSPVWKGDEATKHSKYMRKWRRKKEDTINE